MLLVCSFTYSTFVSLKRNRNPFISRVTGTMVFCFTVTIKWKLSAKTVFQNLSKSFLMHKVVRKKDSKKEKKKSPRFSELAFFWFCFFTSFPSSHHQIRLEVDISPLNDRVNQYCALQPCVDEFSLQSCASYFNKSAIKNYNRFFFLFVCINLVCTVEVIFMKKKIKTFDWLW